VHISGPHSGSSSIQISIQHLQTSANQEEEAEHDTKGSDNLKPTNGLLPHYAAVEDKSAATITPVSPGRLQESTTEIQDADCGLTEKTMMLNQ